MLIEPRMTDLSSINQLFTTGWAIGGVSSPIGSGAAPSTFDSPSSPDSDKGPSLTDFKGKVIGICKGALKTCTYACGQIIKGISYVMTRLLAHFNHRNDQSSSATDLLQGETGSANTTLDRSLKVQTSQLVEAHPDITITGDSLRKDPSDEGSLKGHHENRTSWASALDIDSSLLEPAQDTLTPEIRENRFRLGSELIARKLATELEKAQEQQAKETDKAFAYLSAKEDIIGSDGSQPIAESHRIGDGEVGICHFIGKRGSMEDEHLATSFELAAGGIVYPVSLFGVFDGHGGREASLYVKEHVQAKLQEILTQYCADGLNDEAIWNGLKQTFVRLNQEFTHESAGTTATVAMILDGRLWTANGGDSRTILDTGIQLSEDAKPIDPRYKQGITNRKGLVLSRRVNGKLAVARAIGDHSIKDLDQQSIPVVSARAKITSYPLSSHDKGSHLILACDGIYDVASTRQVSKAVREDRGARAAELAKNIVYSAYQAGSTDNLSALVVKL